MRSGLCLLTLLAFTNYAFGFEQQFADIGDFPVVSGGVIKDCRVGFRVYGDLDDRSSRIIVMPTWFTGTTEDLEQFGVIGPGRAMDTDRFTVISIDALGNGVSSSPSNTEAFPTISTEDMVRSQHVVLTEYLGIGHVYAIVGISMGGIQTFRWLEMYPDFMDLAVPIDGTPQQTSFDVHNWETQKKIVRTMQQAGSAEDEIQVMLSRVGMLTDYTPDYFVENVPVDELVEFQRQSDLSYALNVNDYVAQLEAMISHDVLVDGVPRNLVGRVLVVGAPRDHTINQTTARRYADAAGIEYFSVDSNCGHLGTGNLGSICEGDAVRAKVHAFLAR